MLGEENHPEITQYQRNHNWSTGFWPNSFPTISPNFLEQSGTGFEPLAAYELYEPRPSSIASDSPTFQFSTHLHTTCFTSNKTSMKSTAFLLKNAKHVCPCSHFQHFFHHPGSHPSPFRWGVKQIEAFARKVTELRPRVDHGEPVDIYQTGHPRKVFWSLSWMG